MKGPRALRALAGIVLLGAVYLVAAKLGLRLAFEHASATAVWAPTGIALAAILAFGPRLWPGVFLGAFLANITTQGSVATVAGIAAGNTLEALLGAALVRRFAGGLACLSRPRDVFKFAALAALASTTVSAIVGVGSLALGGYAPWREVPAIGATWWLGDAVGNLVVAPLLIAWIADPRPRWSRARLLELGAWLVVLVGVGQAVFGPLFGAGGSRYALEFLCLPALVWVALRFTPRETATGTFLLAAIALLGTLQGFGPFTREQPHESLLLLQAFMGIAAVTALALAAAVAERRRVEEALRHSEERLRQAEKMEAVGRLAGGVAHDFNNILTSILGYCDLLSEALADRLPLRRDLEEIRNAAQRAAALTRQLLAFGRKQILQPAVLSLNAVVLDSLAALRSLLGEELELVTGLGPELWSIRADRGQVEQVLLNLALNARDAMPGGGRLTIETANVEPGAPAPGRGSGPPAGAYVLLQVSDTGVGMDEATRAHLFEPFFTTKEQGKGAGLGLATVYGIVQQSGGHILVDSRVGAGTRIRVYLPRAQSQAAAGETPVPRAAPEPPRRTVLVVEDDDAVRRMVCAALERFGYGVLGARDGREALAIAERSEVSLDLLLTDMVMPHMSGRELAERLTARLPGLRVILMSGYTEEAIGERSAAGSQLAFLAKPLTPEQLRKKIETVLGGEGRREAGSTPTLPGS